MHAVVANRLFAYRIYLWQQGFFNPNGINPGSFNQLSTICWMVKAAV